LFGVELLPHLCSLCTRCAFALVSSPECGLINTIPFCNSNIANLFFFFFSFHRFNCCIHSCCGGGVVRSGSLGLKCGVTALGGGWQSVVTYGSIDPCAQLWFCNATCRCEREPTLYIGSSQSSPKITRLQNEYRAHAHNAPIRVPSHSPTPLPPQR
jgi:hypothetical protein